MRNDDSLCRRSRAHGTRGPEAVFCSGVALVRLLVAAVPLCDTPTCLAPTAGIAQRQN